jgi:3-oxoacyl-[acyl-carrier protein] reductase
LYGPAVATEGRPLDGKVAIVTGGSRGIGRAIAETLGAQGASVVVNFAEDAEAAAKVVAAIEAAHSRGVAVQGRLDGVQPVRDLFAAALAAFGRIDILVNNAAAARFGPIGDVTESDFDALFAVNAKATFFAFQEASRHLADGGRIISISAALTAVGYDNSVLYAGSKGAVEQFSLAAAKELGKRGIVVNTVSPGATNTDLYNRLFPESAQEVAKQRSPFKRLAEPPDIADLVAFLAGDGARWVSGQNIRANGAALW